MRRLHIEQVPGAYITGVQRHQHQHPYHYHSYHHHHHHHHKLKRGAAAGAAVVSHLVSDVLKNSEMAGLSTTQQYTFQVQVQQQYQISHSCCCTEALHSEICTTAVCILLY